MREKMLKQGQAGGGSCRRRFRAAWCGLLLLAATGCGFRPSVRSWEPWTKERYAQLRTTADVVFRGPAGGPFVAREPVVSLANVGNAAGVFVARSTAPWLVLDGAEVGTIRPGDSAFVVVSVDADAVPRGDGRHVATVDVLNGITYVLESRIEVEIRAGAAGDPVGAQGAER